MNQFESEDEMSEFEQEQFESAEFERTRLEAELTLAMQHVDAPAGFADRVMAKVAAPAPRRAKILMMPRRVRAWVGGAVAAGLLVGAVGIQQQHVRRERAEEAVRARQQYEQALQITGETLDHVRAQLQQAGVPVGD